MYQIHINDKFVTFQRDYPLYSCLCNYQEFMIPFLNTSNDLEYNLDLTRFTNTLLPSHFTIICCLEYMNFCFIEIIFFLKFHFICYLQEILVTNCNIH